jgi:hypothetical protein
MNTPSQRAMWFATWRRGSLITKNYPQFSRLTRRRKVNVARYVVHIYTQNAFFELGKTLTKYANLTMFEDIWKLLHHTRVTTAQSLFI